MTKEQARPVDDEVSLLDLGHLLARRWLAIAGSTLFFGIAVAAISLAMTPIFRARAILMEVEGDASSGRVQAMLGQLGGLTELTGINLEALGTSARGNGRTLIQSRTFVEEFIARNDLLPVIFADDWDATNRRWLEQPPTISYGAEEFKKRWLVVDQDLDTGLFSLSVDWTDPEIAADWANQLVALANELLRQRDIADAEKSVEYLKKQIDETNVVELERVLYTLLEGEQRTLLLANARAEYAFRVVDRAVAPRFRAWPRRTLMTLAGLVCGALIGLTYVLLTGVPALLRERSARP